MWTCHVTRTKKEKNFPTWKCHVTTKKKDAYIGDKWLLQNHSLIFIHKNRSHLSATSILFRSPMAYHTTVSLNKLT